MHSLTIIYVKIPPSTVHTRRMILNAKPLEKTRFLSTSAVLRIVILKIDFTNAEFTICRYFWENLNGKSVISSDNKCSPNLVPTKQAIFRETTTEKMEMNVHIQEAGLNKYIRFHIFVVSRGYLVQKYNG